MALLLPGDALLGRHRGTQARVSIPEGAALDPTDAKALILP